jgi:GntR family transcriptional regulator / MocR family aminotransferase
MRKRASRLPFSVISINPAAPVPLYRQLYDEFRAAILEGRLKAGNKLPPTRELAIELGISRNTVMEAYDQLTSEGYIEGRVGSGAWVASALPEEMLQSRPIPARAQRGSPQHRAISKRGERLVSVLPPVRHQGAGKMLPFRGAFPDLASFPFEVWTRLLAKYSRNPSHDLFGYAHVAGYPRLREVIAAYLRAARAVKCEADQVIIVPGSQVALELATQMLLDPGDTVLMEDPGYFGVRGVFIRAGARVAPVPVDQEGIRLDVVKRNHDNARMVYVTPSHQFPLGVTMSLARRLELLEWARGAGAWIVEDDCDGEYRYAGRPIASLQGLDSENRVIYTGTFSKVLFPSLRIGYLVVPPDRPDLADAFIAGRVMIDLQLATIPQAALADFIEEGHFTRHLRRMRKLYASRQSILLDAARTELSGLLEIQESEAGMHLVGWIPPVASDMEAARVASKHNVLALPLSAFSLKPVTRGALILGYTAFNEREIRAGVRRLKTALAEDRGVKTG